MEKDQEAAKELHEQMEFLKLKKDEYAKYYTFEKCVGFGAFCTVFQAIDNLTNERIAVKVIRKKSLSKRDMDLLRDEAELLKSIEHDSIVQFKHIREVKGRLFLGMELMKGGQLASIIKHRKDNQLTFSDQEASTIMRRVLTAVQHIHSAGIVHRDLKPDNILVGDPDNFESIKVADFGLSCKFDRSFFATMDAQCGTLIFMAPEVIFRKDYTKTVDIWSIGIVMYQLLTGGAHPLYKDGDSAETFKTKLKGVMNLEFPSNLSNLAKNFFQRVTRVNPSSRYTAQDALNHPWLTRMNKTTIPLTFHEQLHSFDIEKRLRKSVSSLFFASIVNAKNNDQKEEMTKYKRLLDKVSNKIDIWHHNSVKQTFEQDEDYIELDKSPTRFDSSSSSERPQIHKFDVKLEPLQLIDSRLVLKPADIYFTDAFTDSINNENSPDLIRKKSFKKAGSISKSTSPKKQKSLRKEDAQKPTFKVKMAQLDNQLATRNDVLNNYQDDQDSVSEVSPGLKRKSSKNLKSNRAYENNNVSELIQKNEAYDQKFLFKKNFIPRHKPVIINQNPVKLPETQPPSQKYKGRKSCKQPSQYIFAPEIDQKLKLLSNFQTFDNSKQTGYQNTCWHLQNNSKSRPQNHSIDFPQIFNASQNMFTAPISDYNQIHKNYKPDYSLQTNLKRSGPQAAGFFERYPTQLYHTEDPLVYSGFASKSMDNTIKRKKNTSRKQSRVQPEEQLQGIDQFMHKRHKSQNRNSPSRVPNINDVAVSLPDGLGHHKVVKHRGKIMIKGTC